MATEIVQTLVQMPILGAIVGAIFYAFIGYAAEFIAPNGNTEPDWFKLGATLIVGAIVGIVMYLGDIEVVSENVWMIMAQYAGAVYVVQKILIGIVSRFSPTVATMRAR